MERQKWGLGLRVQHASKDPVELESPSSSVAHESRFPNHIHFLAQNPSHDRIRSRRRPTHKDALRNGRRAVPTRTRSRSCESGAAAGGGVQGSVNGERP